MILLYVLGSIVVLALVVVGFLFTILRKEPGRLPLKVEPIVNPQEFMKLQVSSPKVIAQNQASAEALEKIQQLTEDKLILESQLTSSQGKLKESQAQADEHQQLSSELSSALEMVVQLKAQGIDVQAKHDASLNEAEILRKAIERARSETEQARLNLEELKLNHSKVVQENQNLLAQNAELQADLVKNRAQASGLEQICENYKLQLQNKG